MLCQYYLTKKQIKILEIVIVKKEIEKNIENKTSFTFIN